MLVRRHLAPPRGFALVARRTAIHSHRTRARATFRALPPEFQAWRIAAQRVTVGKAGNLMRTLNLVISLLAAAANGAAAQTPAVTGLTITNVGTYTAVTTSAPARSGQQSPTNTVGTDVNWRFVSASPDVLGEAGTEFGVEFRIDGAPVGEGVTLYLALTFPPQGIRNPNTGEVMHAAKIAFPNMKIGELSILGYGFDNAWEIVPGVWTEQIWYQDRMLAERSFTVGKAE
jgi:hypothetical protein